MYQMDQLPAGLLSPTFPGMMHCHNSILDFPPCLLFASTEGACSFSINCIESCLMDSTCILRLCVASFPEMQTFIPGKGIRKMTVGFEAQGCRKQVLKLSMKQRIQRFLHICYHLLSLVCASRYMATQIATGEAIGILGNTSRFCYCTLQ